MNRKSVNWVKAVKQIFSPVRKKRAATSRLNLESLDSRVVPALFTVAAGDPASLRAAITAANNDDGTGTGGATETIQIPAGNYQLAGSAGDNKNLTGDLDIFNNNGAVPIKTYVIQGTGATPGAVTIDGFQLDRVFQIIGTDVVVKMQNLTILNGLATDDGSAATPGTVAAEGGGILNTDGADVFLTNMVLTKNKAGGGAAVLDGSAGTSPTVLGKPGGNGTGGQAAYGGAIFSAGGTLTISGANSVFGGVTNATSGNFATGGAGGAGGVGKSATVVGKAGGAGGNGGAGGAAAGGAIYAEAGSVVVSAGAKFQHNFVTGGAGGVGGVGGSNGAKNGLGGKGGLGSDGGDADGGAVYVLAGSLSLTGDQFLTNTASGGDAGAGGAGGAAAGTAGRGGAGGNAGNGGAVTGGAVSVVSGNITIGGASKFDSNTATGGVGGAGGTGGAGNTASGIGGIGGAGGVGGSGLGGAIFAGTGDVTINGASQITNNNIYGSSGGVGGAGAVGNIAGSGGAGGDAGDAAGGGVYVGVGNLMVSGGVTVGTNYASGFGGGDGGAGGAGSGTNGVGGAGGAAGAGGSGSGGGLAVASGNVTIDSGSIITQNTAYADNGGAGGAGGAGGSKGAGGAGGNAGNGGTGSGGGVWAANGTVTLSSGAIVSNNSALGYKGGNGGAGGAASTAGVAGKGGDGGDGGEGRGGGIYVEVGAVVVDGAQVINNTASGYSAGSGGAGGVGKVGGAGGAGGNGGSGLGGGIAIASGDVTVTNGSNVDGNSASAGSGDNGGVGGAGAGTGQVGGVGGAGGNGGSGKGGGIWSLSGTVTVNGGSTVNSNSATGSEAGTGGVGGAATGKAGAGGNGGLGGNGEGGGIWSKDGAVKISGSASVSNNTVEGRSGGDGGSRGAGGGAAPNGNGAKGGSGLGGGIYAGAATVAITGHSLINNNYASASSGGNGGGVTGGAAGTGGDGGDAIGGGVYALSGDVTMASSLVSANSVSADNGGTGGAAGTGLGKGGNGGLAAGGGIAIIGGTLSLDGVNVKSNSAYNSPGDGGAPGIGGVGGNGGSALGGGIYAPATAKGVTILDSDLFSNSVFSGGAGGTGAKGGDVLGGGAYLAAGSVLVQNTTVALNNATNPGAGTPIGVAEGGGLYLASAGAKIHNSTIVYNVADDAGDGIRNKGTTELVSDIVGRNGSLTIGDNHVNTATGIDISNAGTITGSNNLIENALGAGLTNGANNNIVGKSFLNPTFHQTPQLFGPPASQNTVFVDSGALGVPQQAPNGTLYFRLVTPSEFATQSLLDPLTKLPVGALSAIDLGSNPDGLTTDQAGNPRQSGAAVDIGAIEGNGQVNDTSGAFVSSGVFSGAVVNTFDTITVTFSEPIQIGTYGPGDVTLKAPDGTLIPITSITPATPGSNTVFKLAFTPQTAFGVYSLTQGVDILDLAGNQMNQNKNNVNGELPPTSPDDLFITSAKLFDSTDTTPPTVTTAVFSGAAGTFSTIHVTFSEAIDGATVNTSDATLTGPGGPITVLSFTPTVGTTNQFDITFAPQSTAGTYTVTVGPNITDLAGNPMTAAFTGTGDLNVTPPAPDVFAVGGSNGQVRLVNQSTGAVITTVTPISGYTGLVSVALGDFNGDGVADLAVAAANPAGVLGLTAANAGKVFVYDGAALAKGTLTLVHTFTPFANTDGPGGTTGAYVNGLNIAVGDVNGDGKVDLIAGTRGGSATAGNAEFGRLVVLSEGAAADGSADTIVGSILTPFGATYQKGVVVTAGNLDADPAAEIAVTRGGPVAASNPNKTLKVKAFDFSGTGLAELNLSGTGTPLAPFAGITGPGGAVLARDARVAITDSNGDGVGELVVSIIDPFTNSATTGTAVRIAAFSVNVAAGGLATPISTGSGPSNSYTVGSNIVDHAITDAATATAATNLALITESATSQIQYLNPLTGAVLPGGFLLGVVNGGVTIDGI